MEFTYPKSDTPKISLKIGLKIVEATNGTIDNNKEERLDLDSTGQRKINKPIDKIITKTESVGETH